jgi:DNA-binding SARP family transcriptional activator
VTAASTRRAERTGSHPHADCGATRLKFDTRDEDNMLTATTPDKLNDEPLSGPPPTTVHEGVEMTAGFEFSILGPLRVVSPQGELRINGVRRRALLIRLLLSANVAVPPARVAEDLWEPAPPPGSLSTLQSHVSLIRKTLGANRLLHRDGGYLIAIENEELDVNRFTSEVAAGKRAMAIRQWGEAQIRLAAALQSWRGPALVDVDGFVWARPEISRLEGLRLNVLETLIDAHLNSGEHHNAAIASQTAITEDPLRERFWAQLMLALYRCGCQADALRAYQRLRRTLRDELGIRPSRDVSSLEQAILVQHPDLDWFPSKDPDCTEAPIGKARRSAVATPLSSPRNLDFPI